LDSQDMSLSVTEEETAGYATIDLGREIAGESLRLSFRRRNLEPRHLGSGGWQPEATWLEIHNIVQRTPTTVVRIGLSVVSRIDELEQIEIVCDGVGSLGVVWWPAMARPPVDLESGANIWFEAPRSPIGMPQASQTTLKSTPLLPPLIRPPPQPSPIPTSTPKNEQAAVSVLLSTVVPLSTPAPQTLLVLEDRTGSWTTRKRVFALFAILIAGSIGTYWWFGKAMPLNLLSLFESFGFLGGSLACIALGISGLIIGRRIGQLLRAYNLPRWLAVSLNVVLTTYICFGLLYPWIALFALWISLEWT
jgi:hypothetical protein